MTCYKIKDGYVVAGDFLEIKHKGRVWLFEKWEKFLNPIRVKDHIIYDWEHVPKAVRKKAYRNCEIGLRHFQSGKCII